MDILYVLTGLAVVLVFIGAFWRWRLRGIATWFVVLATAAFALAMGLALSQFGTKRVKDDVSTDLGIGIAIGFLGLVLLFAAIIYLITHLQRTRPDLFSRRRISLRGEQWGVVDGVFRRIQEADPDTTLVATVTIPKNYAVVFEDRSGKFTHAEFGPAVFNKQPADAGGIALSTRPIYKRLRVKDISTRDGLVVSEVRFWMLYYLETDTNLEKTANIQYPIAKETLIKATYGVALWETDKGTRSDNWETAVQEMAMNLVRAEIERHRLADLFIGGDSKPGAPISFDELAKHVSTELKTYTDRWGVYIESLHIDYVGIPEHLFKKLEEEWMAVRSEQIKESEAKAQGQALQTMEKAKSEAWSQMFTEMEKLFENSNNSKLLATHYIQVLQYFDSLVQMTRSPSTKMIAPLPQELQSLLKGFDASWAEASNEAKEANSKSSGPKVENVGGAKVVGGVDHSLSQDDSADESKAARG
jgi:regulator of protease activity HflC (stomatin/prohibitin superfamily)